MNKRYYFRLHIPLPELCKQYGKQLPKRDALLKRAKNFTFEKEDYASLIGSERGPIADGILEAVSSWLGAKPQELVEFCYDSPQSVSRKQRTLDVFIQGWDAVLLRITKNREFVLHHKSYLATEQAVRSLARNIELSIGWQAYLDSRDGDESTIPSHEKLLRRAQAIMQFKNHSGFQELLVSWWQANRCVCLAAFDLTQVYCGGTCIVPVSESIYDAIRSGTKSEKEIRGSDVREKSCHFIVIAGSDFAFKRKPHLRAQSIRAVTGCFLAQLAHFVPQGKEKEIRGIGFAATETARQRLANCGFLPIDERLAKTDCQLHEFESENPNASGMVKAISHARRWLKKPR